MTVLCEGRLFELLILGMMVNHKLWIHRCHRQLGGDQATHNPDSNNFMDVLKNILSVIEVVIDGALDMVLVNEVNCSREATELNLVAIN